MRAQRKYSGCTSGKKKNDFFFGISLDLHYLCGKIRNV